MYAASPDHITAATYNRDIDKQLARKLVCAMQDYKLHVSIYMNWLNNFYVYFWLLVSVLWKPTSYRPKVMSYGQKVYYSRIKQADILISKNQALQMYTLNIIIYKAS